MEYIDMESWKRREHFAFFYKMDYPQYNICMDLDITNFLAFTKEKKLPFYYAMIFAAMHSVNKVENFRYRIREGRAVLHYKIHPSFTEMDNEDDELFKIVTTELTDDIAAFVEAAKQDNKNQTVYFDGQKLIGRDDLVYITSLPWISFTHLSHTISLNRNDAVPRISWGKYYKKGEKVWLPFSVQVHHALVDGIHIGKYIRILQDYLNEIEMNL